MKKTKCKTCGKTSRKNHPKKHKLDPIGSIRGFFSSKPHVPKPLVSATPGGSMFSKHAQDIKDAMAYKKKKGKKQKKYKMTPKEVAGKLGNAYTVARNRMFGIKPIPGLNQDKVKKAGYRTAPRANEYMAETLIKNKKTKKHVKK